MANSPKYHKTNKPWHESVSHILGLGDVEAMPLLNKSAKPAQYDPNAIDPACPEAPKDGLQCWRCQHKHDGSMPCPETPKQEWWCKHIEKVGSMWVISYSDKKEDCGWLSCCAQFCPICAAPRPIIKSREERLAEVIAQQWDFCRSNWNKMAKVVIKWCEENK